MRITLTAILFALVFTTQAHADQFRPDQFMINRISNRFREILHSSGINGVGKDVLRCYNTNIEDIVKLKECVLYDNSARLVDKTMIEIFIANGVDAKPGDLFTDRVFAARQNTYGKIAFGDDRPGYASISPAASKILQQVLKP